jgi:hypothetical protein
MASSLAFFLWQVLAKTITVGYNYVQVEVFHRTFLKEVCNKTLISFKEIKMVC